MTLAPGTKLGPYEITSQLGSGGMGVVYTAQDRRLKRQVAIKLLTADLTLDETAKQRHSGRLIWSVHVLEQGRARCLRIGSPGIREPWPNEAV